MIHSSYHYNHYPYKNKNDGTRVVGRLTDFENLGTFYEQLIYVKK